VARYLGRWSIEFPQHRAWPHQPSTDRGRIIETILRTIFSVFLLIVSTHIIGRQAISRLTYLHYIANITLGSIAGNLAFEYKLNALILTASIVLFSVLSVLLSYLALKSRTIKRWVIGEPVTLIDKGKILEKNLAKIHMSLEVLSQSLRRKDIFDINEVECAILETDGELSVLKKQCIFQ
jgi:uncharacterized membrane protein YcaP (DUF421 family)